MVEPAGMEERSKETRARRLVLLAVTPAKRYWPIPLLMAPRSFS
jgi:hypothetical protein